MDEHDLLSRFGLTPVAADLPEIRQLIQSAIAESNRDSNEPLKLLCVQLFSAGIPSDAFLIYNAKMSSFDAASYIDIQLVCGAGFEATEAFLSASGALEAKAVLTLLQDCKRAGDFEGFTPQQQIDSYRHYYGLSS
jgi:hypothetical protein